MPHSVAQARFRYDRELRRLYYRPFVRAVLLFVACILVTGGFLLAVDWRQQREWGSVALQQGEATCVQAQLYAPKRGIGYRTIYRIEGVERTGVWEREGCLVGQHYAMNYKIGRTGQLQVVDRRLLQE